MDAQLRNETAADSREDREEVAYLYSCLLKRLHDFETDIKKAEKFLDKEQMTYLLSQKAVFVKDIEKEKEKPINKTKLRTYYNLVAALITSSDWQSPSIQHSTTSMAGRQTGKIIPAYSDYKRDLHLDEKMYEALFVKEYIDAKLKFQMRALLTNSGMAAFTTVLSFLLMEKKIIGPVVMGKSVWFENKELTHKLCKEKVIEVEESDTTKMIQIIKVQQPNLVIIDSLCNAYELPMPDVEKILDGIASVIKKDTYVILDNTGLSVLYQPFLKRRSYLKVIVIESVMKYFQFGLDRVTAGVIYTHNDIPKLMEVRDHLGTNIADTSVHCLPLPNRKLLTKRLMRFERNAVLLATHLEKVIREKTKRCFEGIVYPGLSHHASYQWAKDTSFHGSYFVIHFSARYRKTSAHEYFISLVLSEAKKRKINIVEGTSFGFDNTRIYLTSRRSDYGTPFIRVSVGTENREEMEVLKAIFEAAILRFEKRKLLFL